MSVLGALAGGYAKAAELDNQRKFEADQQQRQNALGMVKILLENPATPPEYKSNLVQHWSDIVHTPYGKKLPSTDKMLQGLPALNTPAQTQNAPIPSVTLGGPSLPPGAPPPGGPAQNPHGATPPQGNVSGNPMSAPQIAPPEPPPSPMGFGPGSAQFNLPGGQAPVTLAPQPIPGAGPGQFHMLSPAELAQQQQIIDANKRAALSRETGMTEAELMGRPDLVSVPAFGSLYSRSKGGVVATGSGMSKIVGTVPGTIDGVPTMVGRTAQGLTPLYEGQDISNFKPTPGGILTATMPTQKDSSSTYNPDTGTTSTHTTTKKVVPGQSGPGGQAPSTPLSTHVGTSSKSISSGTPGGRIASMADSWANLGVKPSAKDAPYVEKYMAAHGLTPMPPMPAGERSKLTVAFQGISDAQSRYNRMADDLAEITKHPDNTGSFDVDLLSQHIALTFGTVKGVRTGKDLIEKHLEARDLPADLEVMAKRVISGDQLSPAQRTNFIHLADVTLKNKQREYGELKQNFINQYGQQVGGGNSISQPNKPPTVGGGGAHIIEVNGERYQYKGSGPTDDMSSYTKVKQ
jgi:hypothetical protein